MMWVRSILKCKQRLWFSLPLFTSGDIAHKLPNASCPSSLPHPLHSHGDWRSSLTLYERTLTCSVYHDLLHPQSSFPSAFIFSVGFLFYSVTLSEPSTFFWYYFVFSISYYWRKPQTSRNPHKPKMTAVWIIFFILPFLVLSFIWLECLQNSWLNGFEWLSSKLLLLVLALPSCQTSQSVSLTSQFFLY